MQKNTLDGTEKTQAKSTVGSVQGNVNIKAGKDVTIQASDVISGQNTKIIGADVNITAGMETSHEKQSYEYSKSGLTVSVSSPAIDTIQSISNKVDRASEVSDKRLAALYDVQAAQALSGLDKKINNTVNGISEKDDKGNDGKKVSDISLNVSLGSTSKTQNSTNDTRQAKGSQISAGKNLDIIATGTNKNDGNVTIQGSTVTGDKVHIQAVKDVTIESAENQTSNHTQTDGKSSGIGAQISAKGVGFYAETSKNKELENGTILTHTPSVVTAKDTLKIEAGHDVNILGSKASGDRVEVNAGNNLNLASQQDIDNYNEKSSNSGGKIGTAGIGLQGNASKGKIDSNYESVTTQAEIHAGQGGFNIEVGKNTDLKGAVISSDATPDKNKLSTDTLSYSDIKNKADYSESSKGYSMQTGSKLPITPNVTIPVSGDAGSTTKAAIANGSIEIRSNPKQDISQLNRDTGNSLNVLGKIFDKKTVQERQELGNLFGQEAFKAIGDVALKEYVKAKEEAANCKKGSPEYQKAMERAKAWDEGGSNKIWLHALAGGIMSSLGGGSFTSGAAGAGLNEVLQKELAKIKDPGLHELGSMVIGAAAAKLIRQDAKTGMVTALNGTKNNWLNHVQQRAMYSELLAAGTDVNDPEVKVRRAAIYSKYAALDLWNDANEPLKSWNNEIEPLLLQQMSFDMDVATDNGMTGNLAKGLSIYEEYGAYENAQAVRENLNAGTPIDYMVFKALRPELAITPERENYEENRKEREKNESPGDYAYKYDNAKIVGYYPDGTAAVHLEDGDHPAYNAPQKGEVLADDPDAQFTKINGAWYVIDPENAEKCWYTSKEPSTWQTVKTAAQQATTQIQEQVVTPISNSAHDFYRTELAPIGQGVGAAVADNLSFGILPLDMSANNENPRMYYTAKTLTDGVFVVGGGVATVGSVGETIITAPTGVGALAGGVATPAAISFTAKGIYNFSNDLEKAFSSKGADTEGSGEADFIKENRVPKDRETILNNPEYIRTNKDVKGATVYKNGDKYYYRDTFHTGESAHLEVFDKRGKHLGEADPITGEIIPGTVDPSKRINVK